MGKKVDVTIYGSKSKKTPIGTLKKAETFKIASNLGSWYGITFGKGTGYLEKKSVTALVRPSSSGWAATIQPSGTIKMNEKARVVTKTAAGKMIGSINRGQEYDFYKMINDYYAINFGGRVAYVPSKFVTVVTN